jgi:hypothetical protein
MIDFCKLGSSQVTHAIQIVEDLEQQSSLTDEEKNTFNIYNPVTKLEHIMNNFDHIDEFVIPSFFSGADSFYMCCLHIIDKTIAITKLIDAKVILKSFKRDLSYHLDSEKSVYKKLGFNKRKKLTIDYIRSEINNTVLDEIVYIYLSRLLKFDFIIIQGRSNVTHISKKSHTSTYIFKLEDNKYSVLSEAKINTDFNSADFVKKLRK